MSFTDELERIEISEEAAKKQVHLAEILAKLQNNKYFQELFMDYYLESYAARLVRLKASMGMQNDAQQKHIEIQMVGISAFNAFMMFIQQEGEMARKALEDHEEEKKSLLEEHAEKAGGVN